MTFSTWQRAALCFAFAMSACAGPAADPDDLDAEEAAGYCRKHPERCPDAGSPPPTPDAGGGGGTGGAGLTIESINPASGVSIRLDPENTASVTPFSRDVAAGTRIWVTAPLRAGDAYFARWLRDGAAHDTAATTSLVVDGADRLTAVYEAAACTGVAVYPGTDSLHAALAGRPGGTTYCMKAGVHRFTRMAVPRTGDRVIGEPGVVVNGSRVLSSFTREGSAWVASGQAQQEPLFPDPDHCLPSEPRCVYPELVFRDGTSLRHVASLAALGPGTFYFDYAADKIYLFDDPSGHLLEATVAGDGILGYPTYQDSITVKYLVVEKFARGGITGGNGWLVANNEIRLTNQGLRIASNAAARNNHVHHNGRIGVSMAFHTGALWEGNRVEANNHKTDGWDGGGSKFWSSTNVTARGNTFVGNGRGGALWSDYDNSGTVYENNVVRDNLGPGIFHEISCNAVVRYNVLSGNSREAAGQTLWYGGQIFTRNSHDVEVHDNVVDAAGPGVHGIGIRADSVTDSGPHCGTIESRNVSVHHNRVALDLADRHGALNRAAGYGIQFQSNAYRLASTTAAYFYYGGCCPVTKEQWLAAGQDTAGTFDPL